MLTNIERIANDNSIWLNTWFIVSLAFVFLLVLGIGLFAVWRMKILREKQRIENENIVYKLETLRNQINPHFLFNSFNTLAGIVETDPRKAVVFIEKLSDFYRELLTYREQYLISLAEELKLLENYIYLIEQRFVGKVKFDLQIPLDLFSKQIAPLSLQLLLENAIKHNTTSRENPLIIKIYANNNHIIVQNKIDLKSSGVESTGLGLRNLNKRYELISDRKIEINNDQDTFTVQVPLIN
jgi:two-component system LytT family sensor kinase